MSKKGYKDLHIWRESVAFIPDVFAMIQRFPEYERFALADQIRRAAVSIPANIAEGQASRYGRTFLRHLSVAKGSLAELHTLLIVAEQVGYLSPSDLEALETGIEGIAKPLHGLISRLRSDLQGAITRQ